MRLFDPDQPPGSPSRAPAGDADDEVALAPTPRGALDGAAAWAPDPTGPAAVGADDDRAAGSPEPTRRRVEDLEVEVVRSARRRKTIQAQLVGDRLRLLVPLRTSQREIDRAARELGAKILRSHQASHVDLAARAATLARRFGLPTPTSIAWAPNQNRQWGSCRAGTGEVRISDRLASFPPFVLDYVIVHELAHLVEPNHGPAFKALEDRFPKAERARGFLLAKDLEAG